MKFNKKQKEIIEAISNKSVVDMESFIHEFCDIENDTIKNLTFLKDASKIEKGAQIIIISNREKFNENLALFIALCEKLESLGLIKLINKYSNKVIGIFKKAGESGEKIGNNYYPVNTQFTVESSIDIVKHYNKNIQIFNELAEFIENNHLTSAELELNQQKQDRQQAQRWTKIMAVIGILSLIASLILGIISICKT